MKGYWTWGDKTANVMVMHLKGMKESNGSPCVQILNVLIYANL